MYFVRKPCVKKPLCYDFDAETTGPNAHAKLLTGGQKSSWTSCYRVVDRRFNSA
eukprot:gene7994-14112_t